MMDTAPTGEEGIKVSPTTSVGSVEPKKSARLAEKRKLREEAGPLSSTEDDFYFSPLFPSHYSKVKVSPVTIITTAGASPPPSTPSTNKSDSSPSKTSSGVTSVATTGGGGMTRGILSQQTIKSSSPSPNKVQHLQSPLNTYSRHETSSSPSSSSSGSASGSQDTSMMSPSTQQLKECSRDFQKSDHHFEEDDVEEHSSSQEKWLDALESRKMEEEGMIQNSKLLTPRQKALFEKKDNLRLDLIFPNLSQQNFHTSDKEVLTKEMIIKRAEKSQRRKALALQKREFDKKKTVEKLLKKQRPKGIKSSEKIKKKQRVTGPKITYIIGQEVNTISFPPEHGVPCLGLQGLPKIPRVITCGVKGCSNPKKYNCSKTKIPLCSLECYKKNLEMFEDSS